MIRLISFGHNHRDRPPCDLFIDCRHLPNPHDNPSFKDLTGKDRAIQGFIRQGEGSVGVYRIIAQTYQHAEQNPNDTVIAFGCTGGRQRSVATAEIVAENLKALGFKDVTVEHMELKA